MTAETNTAKTILHEIASQAHNLAMGLQNAAPPQDLNNPPSSVLYLLDTAVQLEKTSRSL